MITAYGKLQIGKITSTIAKLFVDKEMTSKAVREVCRSIVYAACDDYDPMAIDDLRVGELVDTVSAIAAMIELERGDGK